MVPGHWGSYLPSPCCWMRTALRPWMLLQCSETPTLMQGVVPVLREVRVVWMVAARWTPARWTLAASHGLQVVVVVDLCAACWFGSAVCTAASACGSRLELTSGPSPPTSPPPPPPASPTLLWRVVRALPRQDLQPLLYPLHGPPRQAGVMCPPVEAHP